jgi:hypothetical protein
MKKIGRKHLILKTYGCKESVSQLNGDDCNLWGGWKRHIQLFEKCPLDQPKN